MQISQIIDESQEILRATGVADEVLQAELIAAHVLDCSWGELQTMAILGKNLTAQQVTKIRELVQLRAERVPLQHLTGKAYFRSIELDVGPGVFSPRPETETVVQYAIDELLLDPSPNPLAIDFCTGSGAIALAIANEVPHAGVWAVEYDEVAHAWANKNVARLGDGRVNLVHADASREVGQLQNLKGRVSVVISNPPYIPEEAIPRDPEVHLHDPQAALYSGTDGLDMVRALSQTSKPLLKPGGLIVFEHAEFQGPNVREILRLNGYKDAATHQDLTRRDRVTVARA